MKNLKKLRQEAGLTQHGLGALAKLPRWKIAHAEVGIVKLTPSEASAIRDVLMDACRKKSARVLAVLAGTQGRAKQTEEQSAA